MRSAPYSRRTAKQEADGFTLPEVLITVVIMGIIVSVLAAVASVVLRTTPTTEARADDARSVQGLVTWLPQDVDSTPPTGFDTTPTKTSGCATSPGTNILHLTWTEKLGATTVRYIANYRHVVKGSAYTLIRVTCNGIGTPPFAGGYAQNLTGDLPPLPVGWTPGNAPVNVLIDREPITNIVKLVTFRLTTVNGGAVKTDSAPKNPANTLPTTTLPSWYIPTPTTGVYVNTPPWANSPTISAYPGPAITTTNLVVGDADGDSLTVQMNPASIPPGWVVNLLSLTLNIAPLASDVGTTKVLSFTVDDLKGGVTTATVTVNVVPTASSTTTTIAPTTTTTGPTTTTSLPSCAVTSTNLSPSSTKNVQADGSPGQVNVGVLWKPIDVTATTNAYCAGMQIRYTSGGVNTPGFQNMTQTGPTTWAVTLLGRDQGSSETWSDGPHPITFHSTTGGPWATATLNVT